MNPHRPPLRVDHTVGAGAWAYFRAPGQDNLEAYSTAYPFVEVNATFYRHASPRQAADWRRRVPEAFEFAVKAHHRITHDEALAPTPRAIDALARSLVTAKLLRAPVLVLQAPATLKFPAAKVAEMAQLLSTANRQGIVLALEARAHAAGELSPPLERAMRDLDLVDATDYSQQAPRTEHEVGYTRLFGKGEHDRHEFTDAELRAIDKAGKATEAAKVFFTFHGVRMYRDAARFLAFKRTGRFPRIPHGHGQTLLAEAR